MSGPSIELVPKLPMYPVPMVEFTLNHTGVFDTVWRPYRNSTVPPVLRSMAYRHPEYRYPIHAELNNVSDVGIEFVPNLTGVFDRVLGPYQTLVGYLPSTYSCHTPRTTHICHLCVTLIWY